MQQTGNVFYVARSSKPMDNVELQFHLVQLPNPRAQALHMLALGYRIVGYLGPEGILYDLDDRPTRGGCLEGDLVMQGEQATLLFPKERDKQMKPLEGLELNERRAVLS